MLTKHHKFPNTKLNRRLYGKDLIDAPANIQTLCLDCHLSKKDGIKIWSEADFCNHFGINPKGKTRCQSTFRSAPAETQEGSGKK
jgi:hypothetical protein